MVLAQDLRNAVLQAALQGKLTEQLDSDSSVDIILQNIEKKNNTIIDINFEESFLKSIPSNWKYVRLGDLLFIARGGSPRPIQAYLTENENGVNWIKIGDTEIGGKYIYSTKEKIKKEGMKKSRYVKEGDFLLTNSMSFGRPYILKTHGCIHDGWLVLSDEWNCFIQDYLYWLLSSSLVFIQFSGMASGAVVKNLNINKVKATIIPFPPIEEQQRIVDIVDELMEKIDEYEEVEKELLALEQKFPDDMKNALLQAAMQGKLTERLDSDSSVDEMLEDIKENDLKGTVRRPKKEIIIEDVLEEIGDSSIPSTWKWVKLGDISVSNIGLTYKPTNISNTGTIVLRSSNIINGQMDYKDIVKVDMDIPASKICEIGDILICARNGSKQLVGKAAIIDKNGMAFGAFMAILKSRCNPYIFYFLNSPIFKRQMHKKSGTETINQITQDMLFNCVIPLPPIEEQQRIVERLEQLLPLCETL